MITRFPFFPFLFYFILSFSIFSSEQRVIHVLVALCDNEYQGIVPVPKKLGNGDDLKDNLYWGAAYGVKSFFKKEKDWKLVSSSMHINPEILERVVFQYKSKKVFLVADAYRGREIKKATQDLIQSLHGEKKETYSFELENQKIILPLAANADLLGYIGHNGLMDFSLELSNQSKLTQLKPVIILACYSKSYFSKVLDESKTKPILWSNGLMAPESYVLKAGIDSWLKNEKPKEIIERAANAYNNFQKCGMKGARKLFSSGYQNYATTK